jgi:hypothetical protein
MAVDPPFSRFYVYYIMVFLAVWLPMRYYTPLTFTVRNTYQLPTTACTGTLISDFNTFEAVREGIFEFIIIVPFSMCFMIWTREKIGWYTHIIVIILALLWSITMLIFDIFDIVAANVPPSDPIFRITNLARDNRYCLYYAGQPGTELLCTINSPCGSVDPSSLMPNGPFTYRFGLNILILVMIGYAFYLAWIWKQKMIDEPAAAAAALEPPQKIKYASRFEERK